MSIKEPLKEHLSTFNTAPFLFIGSGVSRRYLKLENWGELLEKFSTHTKFQYQYYYTSQNGNYPKIATAIAKEFHEVWWTLNNFEKHRNDYKNFCVNDESALKIEISHYIKNIKVEIEENDHLLEEIELLRKATIDGIITTNWDLFLENIFEDFKPYIGQSELLFSVPQGIGEIYKIHGCCSVPDTLVLTDKDYKNFQDRNPYLAAKMLTIFTEHPILFFGYSLTDENIINIIKSITNCLTNSNIEKLRDRLIFVKYSSGLQIEYIERSTLIVENFQIPIMTIYVKSYKDIFQVLSELQRKFPAKLLRKLKEHVYDLVINKKNGSQFYVTDIDEASDNDEVDIVFGVGAISKIKGIGYKSISRKDLFEDLIYDNDIFESSKIIEDTLPNFGSKTFIPIFKYLRNDNLVDQYNNIDFSKLPFSDTGKFDKLSNKVNEIISNGISYFNPPVSYTKKRADFLGKQDSLSDYIRKYSMKDFLKYYTLFDEQHLQTCEVFEIISNNFSEFMQIKGTFEYTQFIKLMCLYDYLKYYRDYK